MAIFATLTIRICRWGGQGCRVFDNVEFSQALFEATDDNHYSRKDDVPSGVFYPD